MSHFISDRNQLDLVHQKYGAFYKKETFSPAQVTRGNRTFIQTARYIKPISNLHCKRVTALFIAIFTLGIIFTSEKFRDKWSSAFSGKKVRPIFAEASLLSPPAAHPNRARIVPDPIHLLHPDEGITHKFLIEKKLALSERFGELRNDLSKNIVQYYEQRQDLADVKIKAYKLLDELIRILDIAVSNPIKDTIAEELQKLMDQGILTNVNIALLLTKSLGSNPFTGFSVHIFECHHMNFFERYPHILEIAREVHKTQKIYGGELLAQQVDKIAKTVSLLQFCLYMEKMIERMEMEHFKYELDLYKLNYNTPNSFDIFVERVTEIYNPKFIDKAAFASAFTYTPDLTPEAFAEIFAKSQGFQNWKETFTKQSPLRIYPTISPVLVEKQMLELSA